MKTNDRGLYRHVLAGVFALALGLVVLLSATDRLWAAIELAYYRASATNNAVFLEWATVREFNLNGFEILCKRSVEPVTAYHPIGSRIAQGTADTGATYNFNVTSGLIAGESYCFRLREVTSDGTPGEAFDLCGYGPGLTPAPTPTVDVAGLSLELTPTTIAVEPVPGLEVPGLPPTLTPIPPGVFPETPTPLPGQQPISPLADPNAPVDPNLALTPTVDPFATWTPTVDPFITIAPTVDPAAPITPIGMDPNSAAIAQAQMQAETPTALPTDTPFPTETATEIATETPTQPASPLAVDPAVAEIAAVPDAYMAQAVAATATPPYVVVTATPTPEGAGVAMLAPTFTPWPTAMPTPSFSLDSLLVPSTQNLMVGLLCLIFVSASGLGALGLVTSVLYMRSQSQREAQRNRLPGPLYERRRY